VRPVYHPYQVNEFVITSARQHGRIELRVAVTSSRAPGCSTDGEERRMVDSKVKPVGDSLKPRPGNQGHFAMIAERARPRHHANPVGRA
jgi:hypothetical protein